MDKGESQKGVGGGGKKGKKDSYFKVILIGDASVGKSSMVNNYINGNFATEYQVTIGLEFASKEITLQDGTTTKLQIWDAAGQECFRSIVRSFYRNASAFIIVYNICEPKTFHNVQYWIQDAKEHQTENGICILVGNQCDREDERQVAFDVGQEYANGNGFDHFMEVSAKTGKDIDKLFSHVAELLHTKAREKYITPQIKKDNTATLKSGSTNEGGVTEKGSGKGRCSC